MAKSVNLTRDAFDALVAITDSTSITVPTSVYTAPGASGESLGGAKVGVFRAVNFDTTKDFNLFVYKSKGGTNYPIDCVPVGRAASATSPTVVDLLDYIWGSATNLEIGVSLEIMPDVAPAAGKSFTVHAEGAIF